MDGLFEVVLTGINPPNIEVWSYTVNVGGSTTVYRNLSSASSTATMASESKDGSTLTYNGSNGYTQVLRDGTIRLFSTAYAVTNPYTSPPISGPGGQITQMTKPDGEQWDWHYRSETVGTDTAHRVQSVTNNHRQQIKFEIHLNGSPTTAPTPASRGAAESGADLMNCGRFPTTVKTFTRRSLRMPAAVSFVRVSPGHLFETKMKDTGG